MIKKLNNKGLTVIEVLVCFALASVIIISMFNVVNSYRSKHDIESYKLDIKTYKNGITKTVQDDIILNYGVKNASINNDGVNDDDPYNFTKIITLNYINGKTAKIEIYNQTRCYTKKSGGQKKKDQDCPNINDDDSNDNVDSEGYKHDSEYVDYENSVYYINFIDSTGASEKFELPRIFFLRFNDVWTTSGTEELDPNGFVKIHVGLIHPDLGADYDALNIITPNVTSYPNIG